MDELRAASMLMPPDELYDLVIERTGYVKALEEKNTQENTARIENVQELKTNIVNYLKEEPEGNLAGFLDEVALYTDIDNYDREADCVTMMTMHAAKGLEFPTVFVVGCEEGIFPGLRAIGEQDEMEEERRLCYVALTRAKKHLFLTCASQRMLFGRTTANRISRFVEEIPEDDIVKKGVTRGYGYSEPTSQQREYQQYVERQPRPTHTVSAPPRPAAPKTGRDARLRARRPCEAPRLRLRRDHEGHAHGRRRAAGDRIRVRRPQAPDAPRRRTVYEKGMTMRYTTVLFDLDGTLLDTLDDLTDAVNRTLERYGLPQRSRREVRAFLGNGARYLMEHAAPGVAGERFEQLLRDYKADYDANCRVKTAPYPGIDALLRALRARGVKTGIISNKPDSAVQPLYEAFFADTMDAAVGERDGHPPQARAGHRPCRHGAARRSGGGDPVRRRLRGGYPDGAKRRRGLRERDLGLSRPRGADRARRGDAL